MCTQTRWPLAAVSLYRYMLNHDWLLPSNRTACERGLNLACSADIYFYIYLLFIMLFSINVNNASFSPRKEKI